MTDSVLRNNVGQFTSAAKMNDPKWDGVVCGGRKSDAVLEARRHKLYNRQLEGLTIRQLVLDHAKKENIAVDTAWRDWKYVKKWNEEDWEKDREKMISRIQGMRMRLYEKAVKRGQYQTAAQILDSLGKVLGESVENININAPQLSIQVEEKKST